MKKFRIAAIAGLFANYMPSGDFGYLCLIRAAQLIPGNQFRIPGD